MIFRINNRNSGLLTSEIHVMSLFSIRGEKQFFSLDRLQQFHAESFSASGFDRVLARPRSGSRLPADLPKQSQRNHLEVHPRPGKGDHPFYRSSILDCTERFEPATEPSSRPKRLPESLDVPSAVKN